MKKIIAIFIFVIFLVSLNVPLFQVYGGTVDVELIRDGMFDGSELGGDWRCKGKISLADGRIFFNDKSVTDNIVINYTAIKRSQNVKNTFYINFNIDFDTFTENKKFGLAYGLENFVQNIGSARSTFIYFEKTGANYYAGINTYDANGNAQTVLAKTQLPSTVDVHNISVEVTIKNDNNLTLKIDGDYFFFSTDSASVGRVEGLIGFGQVGAGVQNVVNKIYVTLNQLTNLYYDTPTTPRETVLTFDNDEFNKNEWSVINRRVDGSRGIVVEDGALFFDGAGYTSSFETKYVYSNFELMFDVYGAKTTDAPDSPSGPSGALCVAFGDGYHKSDDNPSPVQNGTFLVFRSFDVDETGERSKNGTRAYIHFNGKYEPIGNVPEKYAFLSEGFDPTVKVRICIKIVDGVLEVKMKLVNEVQYETLYTHVYPNYNTPSGCIRLMGHHIIPKPSWTLKYNRPTNLKIDDIRIYNFDVNPSVAEVEFVSNKTKEIPDYQYKDTWSKNDLLDVTFGK